MNLGMSMAIENRLNLQSYPGGVPLGGGAAHNPPASPLFLETLEGVGYTLGGWTENLSGGTIDEDYTGVILDGSQSLLIRQDGLGATFVQRSVTAIGQIFLFFKWRATANFGETVSLLEVQDNVSTVLGGIYWDSNTEQIKVRAGAAETTLTAGCQANITYNFWFERNKNNGANHIVNVGFSTSPASRPTSGSNYGQAATTISAVDTSIVAFGLMSSGFSNPNAMVFDYLLADDAQIGNNP